MDQTPDLIVYPMTDIVETILERLDPERTVPRDRIKEVQIHGFRTRVVVHAVDENGHHYMDECDNIATRVYDFNTIVGKLKESGEK